jgi:hypothetical protein
VKFNKAMNVTDNDLLGSDTVQFGTAGYTETLICETQTMQCNNITDYNLKFDRAHPIVL